MKNLNKVRISGTKYLMFKSNEQRNKFVLMYKDLFVPYSDVSGGKVYYNAKDEATKKQLLSGYQINPPILSNEYDSPSLLINIKMEDWNKIKKVLCLKKKYYKRWRNCEYSSNIGVWSLE